MMEKHAKVIGDGPQPVERQEGNTAVQEAAARALRLQRKRFEDGTMRKEEEAQMDELFPGFDFRYSTEDAQWLEDLQHLHEELRA